MSDITMCNGKGCAIKDSCYRHKAPKNLYMQSYFTKPPFTITKGKFECEMYWGENSEQIFNQLKDILK